MARSSASRAGVLYDSASAPRHKWRHKSLIGPRLAGRQALNIFGAFAVAAAENMLTARAARGDAAISAGNGCQQEGPGVDP
jgi:hypothetical protein